MPPGTEKLDSLLGDLLLLEEGLEHFLAEEVFERSEVDVFRSGVEDSVAGEDAEGGESVSMGMVVEEVSP